MRIEKLKEEYSKFKDTLSERNKKLFSILMFLIKFGVASIPLYLIYFSNINFKLLEYSEAILANSILQILGIQTELLEVISPDTGFKIPAIKIGNVMIGIDRPCTGYRSYFALLGLIFATPGVEVKRKIRGALYGAVSIYFINLLRLLITSLIGKYYSKSLKWVDSILWGWGLIFVVFGVWLAWYKDLKLLSKLKELITP